LSKFSYETLKECVYPYQGAKDPDVLLGPEFGEDVSLTRFGNGILASHVDPIIGAIENIGRLAVHISCNDIATAGIRPRWILTLVLVPDPQDKNLVKEIMQDINTAAQEINVAVIGGHTGYSSGITRPLVSVTALGTSAKQTPIRTSGARIGDHILITKGIALEGTSILAQDFADVALDLGLTKDDLSEAARLVDQISVIEEATILAKCGATAMHDVTRGGLFETLLEIALLSSVGIDLDVSKLLIPNIVTRFAESFNFDPLRMISSGTLAASVPFEALEETQSNLQDRNIPFADIGMVIPGEGVYIHEDQKTTHHTGLHAESDELARLWALHPRNQ